MGRNIRRSARQLRVALAFSAVIAVALGLVSPAARADGFAGAIPNGTYTYAVIDSVGPPQASTIVVSRTGQRLEIAEHSAPMEGGEVTRRSFDATTMAAHTFTDDVDGQRMLTLTFNGPTATLHAREKTLSIQRIGDAPFVAFDVNVGSFFQLPAALAIGHLQSLTLANIFLNYSALPLVANATSPPARPASVRPDAVALNITLDDQHGTMYFDPQTLVLEEIDLPKVRLAIKLQGYVPMQAALP